jgi:hypothetical protein
VTLLHGFRMVYAWFSHGLCKVYAWFTHGFRVVFAWFTQGFRKVYAWFSHGLRLVYARVSQGIRMVYAWFAQCFAVCTMNSWFCAICTACSVCAIRSILIWGHAGLVHALLRKESVKNGGYSFQGSTYSFHSPDASFARQDALRRSAPKSITRSDTFSRLMMESLRSDWPGEVPSSGIYTAGARGEAKKTPALRPTDVYWPWPLKRADLALPVWKQQRLFRLNREYWTDWTGRFISLSFGYLMYEYSCLLGSDVT